MTEQLKDFDISQSDIEKLEAFKPRDGFVVINDGELAEMLAYFSQFPVYKGLVPILTDENSNYCCVYVEGPLKGMVCNVSHDELNTEPKFRSLSRLLDAIDYNRDAYSFLDFEDAAYDFPSSKEKLEFPERAAIMEQLYAELKAETDESRTQQLAYSIMALTTVDEMETHIYPFIDNEDMYIQERAIQLLGFHKYKPAWQKLEALTTTAMPNGRTAAQLALNRMTF